MPGKLSEYYERINQALKFIEQNLFDELSLDKIAAVSFLSPFHFHRMFQALVGDPVMSYVRNRRFSEILELILNSRYTILDLALMCGFRSNEAFTRSFKEFYNVSPKRIRTKQLKLPPYPTLVDKIPYNQIKHYPVDITGPEFIELPDFTLTGVGERLTLHGYKVARDITGIWKRVMQELKRQDKSRLSRYFGIGIMDTPSNLQEGDSFYYMAGVNMNELEYIPDDWQTRQIPGCTYAVFTYNGPIRRIRDAHHWVYREWLYHSIHEPSGNYSFEGYCSSKKLNQAKAGAEIWIPLVD